MTGETHKFIANMALACLDIKKRYILYPRWGGIESGAVISDEFRILWEIEEVGSKKKQLVHRGYVYSDDPKDHGGITRVFDHSVGSISFINDYLADGLEGYTEEEFLENLGIFGGGLRAIILQIYAHLCMLEIKLTSRRLVLNP